MTLKIIIKKQYFDEILNGLKIEEFRLVSRYWKNKLVNREYNSILFINGYGTKKSKI